VAHSQGVPGRYVVGIAFGWHADVGEAARPIYRKPAAAPWYRLFSRKARRRALALSHRD
jgi:hypothetical protein